MKLDNKIKAFLERVEDVSLGYLDLTFIKEVDLEQTQKNYQIIRKGEETDNDSWEKEWLIIALDSLGDQIVIDKSTSELEVCLASYEEDCWDLFSLASNLSNFEKILNLLTELSINRQQPVEIENNPLTEKDIKNFITKVEKINGGCSWYWENFVEECGD